MEKEIEIMQLINEVFGSNMPSNATIISDNRKVAEGWRNGVFHEIPSAIKERFSDPEREFTGIMVKPSEKGWDVESHFTEWELDECGNEFGQSRYMKIGTIEK